MASVHGRVGIDDVLLRTVAREERSLTGLCCSSRLPCLSSTGALITRHILFSEALLDGFGFPIIVANPPASFDDPRSKLAEH